ncbi:MAG: IS1182 family transposase [Erysipelotrichaceae bacterium]
MTMTRSSIKDNSMMLRSIEEVVPKDHLVRKLERSIDWDFIYEEVEDLYAPTGRRSIDPVVLFKMIFINYMFGYNSMRRTCRETEVNLAYRWFLGLSIEDKVPDYSTWSQNYIRRYGDSEVFEKIFDEIIGQAYRKRMINLETVYGDSTHQKACANRRKAENKEIELTRKVYEEQLLEEINEDRKAHGKKPFEDIAKTETVFDENGKEVEVTEKKNIKVSKTDPESGLYHKGEREQMFAYSHQTFCDGNGFVLTAVTVPGNIHDSVSFYEGYDVLVEKYKDEVRNVCLDAGYNNSAICKTIMDNNQTIIVPYHRPMTKKGYYKKYEFIYDEEENIYICPMGCVLKYSTTSREGYRQYRACESCEGCPFKDRCTGSDRKTITRHVWEQYREQANLFRKSELWKQIYPKRKQTIERVFADNKENHGLRFTRLKGLRKNQHQALMIFSCHNMKKMALLDHFRDNN